MTCDECLEDLNTYNYRGYELCRYCMDRAAPKIDARISRDERIGHTGSDLCGCEMCAARADAET